MAILRRGEVAEWSNAAVSKTVMGVSSSRVRIPPSPPVFLLTAKPPQGARQWPRRPVGLAEPGAPGFFGSRRSLCRGRRAREPWRVQTSSQPGSNVASNFVETGIFAADGALHLSLEGMLALGPLSLQGEWVRAEAAAPTLGNPDLGNPDLGNPDLGSGFRRTDPGLNWWATRRWKAGGGLGACVARQGGCQWPD
jgi:hypothetical protein